MTQAGTATRSVFFQVGERVLQSRIPFHRFMAQEADDDFCEGFLEWLVASDFVEVPWSTEFAAEQFKVDKKVIYEALAKVAKKYPNRVQIMWSNGSLAIAAE